MIPKHTVIQYIRKKKNRIPYGVVVAIKDIENGYRIGYSLCNKKDRFNKKRALEIALGRAFHGVNQIDMKHHEKNNVNSATPHDVNRMLSNFNERCKKYYKWYF